MNNNENEQVTITFGGYDETPDNTIMFEGPLNVWKTIDNVDSLYLLDISQFEIGTPIIVYVKNINKEQDAKGKLPYRGSFFKYDWDKSGWQQIALGNHSHANIEILDQIGNIDAENLPIGAKKVITIEKIDPDQDNNELTTDYKVSFEDKKELPDVPMDAEGKNLYLTANNQGTFEWQNNFAPAQTFKIFNILVNSEFLLPEDQSKNESKTIIVKKSYLNDNEILFSKELHDEILIFDNGLMVPNLSYNINENEDLIITINNDNAEDKFLLNESLTIIIIRNGISGIIDTFEKQYLTKKDAIELLSNGTIHLDQYTTKQDLKKYSAKINHTHSQYIRKDEYDIFDFRYADYQHTHSEYVTPEQVLGIIGDIASDHKITDPNSLFQEIKNTIDKRLVEFDNKFYSKEAIDLFIKSAKDEVSNSDAIEVTFDGRNLTEYLKYLDKKQIDLDHIDDHKVLLSDLEVQLGTDNEGNPQYIGGLKTGDTIAKGTTLDKFLKKLVQKKVDPILIKPEINYDYKITSNDAGQLIQFSITPHFKQNNGGKLLKLELSISNTLDGNTNSVIMLNDNEEYKTELVLSPYKDDGESMQFTLIAKYGEGPYFSDNLHIQNYLNIPAGEITVNKKIYSQRNAYLGFLPCNIDNSSLTGDTLYQHIYNSKAGTLHPIDLNKINYKDYLINFDEKKLVKSIIFAIPVSSNFDLDKIIFLNQYCNMKEDFELKLIEIPDASNKLNNNLDNNYKVYYFNLAQNNQSDLNFKLEFNNKGEE